MNFYKINFYLSVNGNVDLTFVLTFNGLMNLYEKFVYKFPIAPYKSNKKSNVGGNNSIYE